MNIKRIYLLLIVTFISSYCFAAQAKYKTEFSFQKRPNDILIRTIKTYNVNDPQEYINLTLTYHKEEIIDNDLVANKINGALIYMFHAANEQVAKNYLNAQQRELENIRVKPSQSFYSMLISQVDTVEGTVLAPRAVAPRAQDEKADR